MSGGIINMAPFPSDPGGYNLQVVKPQVELPLVNQFHQRDLRVPGQRPIAPPPPTLNNRIELLNHTYPDWQYRMPPNANANPLFRSSEATITPATPLGPVITNACQFTLDNRQVAVLHQYGVNTLELLAGVDYPGQQRWQALDSGSFSGKFRWLPQYNGSNQRLQADANGPTGALFNGFLIDQIYRVREGAPPLVFEGPGTFRIELDLIDLTQGGTVSTLGAKFIIQIDGYKFVNPS